MLIFLPFSIFFRFPTSLQQMQNPFFSSNKNLSCFYHQSIPEVFLLESPRNKLFSIKTSFQLDEKIIASNYWQTRHDKVHLGQSRDVALRFLSLIEPINLRAMIGFFYDSSFHRLGKGIKNKEVLTCRRCIKISMSYFGKDFRWGNKQSKCVGSSSS